MTTPSDLSLQALQKLDVKQRRDVLHEALHALQKDPLPEARPALIELYQQVNRKGIRNDQGGFLRKAILDTLRPIKLPADEALFLQAVNTYEFYPPDFHEDAVQLRATGLVILNELNDLQARYQATRLLVDPHTDKMSGEPALTAVRVLASLDEILPLYFYVLISSQSIPEVVSESLRNLTTLPTELIPGLVERFNESPSGIIRLGLYELIIHHHEGPQEIDYVARALAVEPDVDVFRYLVITLFSARSPELVHLVRETLRLETRRDRQAIIEESMRLWGYPIINDPDEEQ